MSPTLRNPILPGFYPDPSICRVGDDYYLVNSTFEYFPGVPVFHSRDLVNWRQIGHCLTRVSQLNLAGVAPSDGIYAPTIRHHDGTFYMVTTVREAAPGFRNFYVHTKDPEGAWSDPVWVDQGGIDPSLWFDDDGRVYFTSNGTGWAPVRGAYQCEIDILTGRRLSETRFLWPGTGGCYPEAPHLFRRGDFYYLTLAEGGTADGHMVTIARSTSPWGPFESCPHNPILTHRSVMNPIQATGHADLFEDARGQWWAVFLGIRYAGEHFHNLGRETFLAPVAWTDDHWPIVNESRPLPLEQDCPMLPAPHPWPANSARDSFASPSLAAEWVHLRGPLEDRLSLTARPGWLGLRADAATLDDLASPTLLARRQQHVAADFTARMEFAPGNSYEQAGLTVLIDHRHHYEIAVTLRNNQRVVIVRQRVGDLAVETHQVSMIDESCVLGIHATPESYAFSVNGTAVGSAPARYLSTEVAGGYTGVMFGLYASSTGRASGNFAWFDWAEYAPKL